MAVIGRLRTCCRLLNRADEPSSRHLTSQSDALVRAGRVTVTTVPQGAAAVTSRQVVEVRAADRVGDHVQAAIV